MTVDRIHHGIGNSKIGCHVKTPKTPMTAPTVVYQNKMPHRKNQLASGRKNGKAIKPTRPKIKPIPLPTVIRVMSDGLFNIAYPPFAVTRASLLGYPFKNTSKPLSRENEQK